MHFTISGKQMDVGDALRGHVMDALTQVTEKYFDRPIEGAVTFTRVAHLFHAHVSVHVGRGLAVLGEGKGEDAYKAFDAAVGRIGKQLRRYKRKLRDHHNGSNSAVESLAAPQYILAGSLEDADGASEEGRSDNGAEMPDGDPAVIAEMTMDIPTLAVSEAVMRLDLAGQSAMMFRNRAHGGLNMLYRRPDGNIGWVDPDGAPT